MTNKQELVIATFNRGKMLEIQEALASLPVSLSSLAKYAGFRDIEETGNTFAQNARLKAVTSAIQLNSWALGDDSGLAVDSLNGAPGIFSARYAGKDADDRQRIEKLLKEMADVPEDKRGARFVCTLALVNNAGIAVFETEAVCEGRIERTPRGANGFGYDPIFVPEGHDLTFGELGATIKSQISHRAKALASLKRFLETLWCETRLK